jgi:hypothetical protein
MIPIDYIIENCKKIVRKELNDEVESLIRYAPEVELEKIFSLISRNIHNINNNIICIELDFLATRLKYFGYLQDDFITTFGFNLDDVPDLLGEWREEKLNNLIKK